MKKNIIFLNLLLVLFTACSGPFLSEVNLAGRYRITYLNMDGARNHFSNPLSYNIQNQDITLQSPTKAKVYFVCWRLDDSSGKPVSSIPAGSTGNKTLYAQWTTEEEYNVIAETNRVRTNPRAYANMLQGELAGISNTDTRNKYQAAIATLNSTESRGSVSFERGLYFAARVHAEDLIKTNKFSHDSSDGTSFGTRLRLFGTFSNAGENIAAGTNQNTGAKVVKQWVLSPGHLNNILNVNYNQLGASLIPGHQTYNWVSVQDFARNFISNPL